jgi:hypothetical protein
MRIAKWISPVIVGLGLTISVQSATAGLFDLPPGACKPVKACEPVKKVEPLPPACEPVHVYVPRVNACGPVKACEPVKTCEGTHEAFVLERAANRVDRAVHVVAYKLHTWKHASYATRYSPAPCAPVAPAPVSAPALLPAAPAPASANHS